VRIHAAPDLSLFTGHLADLKANLELLTKHLGQAKDDLEPCTLARVQDRLQELEMALLGLECDTCEAFASVDRDAGQFCETCSDRYAVCAGCAQDVLISEAVEAEYIQAFDFGTRKVEMGTDYWHGPCCPEDRAGRILDRESGQ